MRGYNYRISNSNYVDMLLVILTLLTESCLLVHGIKEALRVLFDVQNDAFSIFNSKGGNCP
jgi:hypothetical protein